ncbi:MAG: AAA family ATPase [Chloroflexi bacterium]|nr:AAA family ATPase [Chloroflexota bacterium]
MNKTPVAIIDKEKNNVDKIRYLLEKFPDVEIIQSSTSLDDLEILLDERISSLVLIGPSYKLEDIEQLLRSYYTSLRFTKIILLVRETSADLLKKAIKLNIYDVLEIPFTHNDIKEAIKRAEENIEDKKAVSKRITVFGTKGGVGKSFLAVNLAVGLMDKNKKRVSLIDTNYQFGDIALMMDLHPKYSVYDILPVIEQLDSKILDSFLTTHSSGVKVLPAPLDISTSLQGVNSKTTMKILDTISRMSDYIVIDTSSYFSEYVLNIFKDTDYLVIVSSKDTPSIKNLKIVLQILEQIKFPEENIYIILNRADSKVGITIEEIEETIQRKIDIAIPSDRIVPISVNKGVPLIIGAPRSAVTKSIYKLIKIITENKKRK